MSFTRQTTNYGLPQWQSGDVPSYLVDQNGAYETIDTNMKRIDELSATADSKADSAQALAEESLEVGETADLLANHILDSIAPRFSSTTTYPNVGTVVTYNGILYKSNQPITIAGNFNGSQWDIVKLTELLREVKNALAILEGKTLVESITDGDWHIHKFSDGTFEAWCYVIHSSIAMTSGPSGAYGGYRTANAITIPLPQSVRSWSIDFSQTMYNGGAAGHPVQCAVVGNEIGGYWVCGASETRTNARCSYLIKGRWS